MFSRLVIFSKKFYTTISPFGTDISDSNWIRTHNHLVRKRTLDHLAKLFG